MYAINHARYMVNEDYKENGNFSSKPLQIFTSDQVSGNKDKKLG